MGALHQGHISLVETAAAECDFVVTTIFVNPTQFGPNEDFDKYPRTLEDDLAKCKAAGADLVFVPDVAIMYPKGSETTVRVAGPTEVLEGAHRPGHFDGVTTIVAKLFHVTEPDKAFFGQKDFQQQLVIRRMVEDLNWALEIVMCPTVREADGLAMSSRNRYLSAAERQTAVQISAALREAEQASTTADAVPSVDGLELDYAVVVDSETLQPISNQDALVANRSPAVALIAAKVGATRLIDNQILGFRFSHQTD
ncbi:UNVERIFIED_CONTAM: hypothetical protein GTU68_006598 [Idotea baltica]|nr:hypothetical protein [Idotea baltica]